MTHGKSQITKFEAAQRQLVTAIRLFFEDADSVSVYTLAHAAWEVLDALCKNRNKIRFRHQISGAHKTSESEIKKITNYGRNFFKHADRDPNDVLEDFSDYQSDHVLIAATMDFGMLSDTKPLELLVFQFWYFAVHPEKAPKPDFQNMFPGIASFDRGKQKAAGLQALMKGLRTLR